MRTVLNVNVKRTEVTVRRVMDDKSFHYEDKFRQMYTQNSDVFTCMEKKVVSEEPQTSDISVCVDKKEPVVVRNNNNNSLTGV